MSTNTFIDPNVYSRGAYIPTDIIFAVDVSLLNFILKGSISYTYTTTFFDGGNGVYINLDWSVDGVIYTNLHNDWTSNKIDYTTTRSITPYGNLNTIYIKVRTGYSPVDDANLIDVLNIGVTVVSIPESLDFDEVTLELPIAAKFIGYNIIDDGRSLVFDHIITQVEGGGGGGAILDPTSNNIISGNVKKLGLPFKANVVAVSIGLDPQVVGETVSDVITGDYSMDIFPHTEEVLIYVAPDYGRIFSAGLLMTTGQIIHPTVPNKLVYVAQNDGTVGFLEPNWGTGEITSNEVTFSPEPLHRPIMNGFVKPVVTPI